MYLKEYDREKACNYALKWALKRNHSYYDFENNGGDCTNFVSQCLYAGCGVMNYTPVVGWFYSTSSYRTASWTSAKYLRKFLLNNQDYGPFAQECDIENVEIGDIIQLGNSDTFYHSLFLTEINEPYTYDNLKVCAHSFDALNKMLSNYFFEKVSFLHIKGVNGYN